jgi:hypothetical protein
MMRAFLFVLAFALAAPAHALERNDVLGEWITQWANAAGQVPESGGPLRVSADTDQDSLDGLMPAPGWRRHEWRNQ